MDIFKKDLRDILEGAEERDLPAEKVIYQLMLSASALCFYLYKGDKEGYLSETLQSAVDLCKQFIPNDRSRS